VTGLARNFRSGLGIFVAALLVATAPSIGAQSPQGNDNEKSWEAVAPGVVEPRSGEIRMLAPVIGRITEVAVGPTDMVLAGERLIQLDDEEARARLASAQANFAMRKRVRNEQSAGKGADRRKAEDAVADAEAALVEARSTFDKAAAARRSGGGAEADVTAARTAWTNAQETVAQKRGQLRKIEAQSDTPLPTQAEGALDAAHGELRLAVAALDDLTIRAPIAGTVLQVNAKIGELAAPTAPRPLLSLGDLSALRVRAELDERDIGKIKPGQNVVVRSEAFASREFAGKVTTVAPMVQPAHINASGARNLTDFSVAEVLIDIADASPLVVGLKVDVYFPREKAAQ
jgi:HlyD family secretion protein